MNLEDPLANDLTGPSMECPACKRAGCIDFFTVENLPVNVGFFYDSQSQAHAAPRGNIKLTYCPFCGFVQNRAFDLTKVVFEPGYEVALHHSETFRDFMQGVANRLVKRFELKQKRIVEIGCGDAYFLDLLAETGANQCVGIDPTVTREGAKRLGDGSVQLVRDYFGHQHLAWDADFICCLSVFEDIPKPSAFLADVRRLATRHHAPLYFEVFNAWRAFEHQEIWSVHYEQCNYFSLSCLEQTFLQNGFTITDSGCCYAGDQYLYVEAIASDRQAVKPAQSVKADLPLPLASFERVFSQKLAQWNTRLNQYQESGERVVVWGTGGKGITFLNTVDAAKHIEFVAEINPDKQGRFVPGSGQAIVPPEFLAEYQPHKIIITNALYAEEMKRQARDLGVNAEFLVA